MDDHFEDRGVSQTAHRQQGDLGCQEGSGPLDVEGLQRSGLNHRARPQALWLRAWCWCSVAVRDFFYLVFPAECAACGVADQALCPECAAEIRHQTAAPFRADGTADALMGVFGEAYLPVMAAGHYRDALAAAILAFKNHGRTELAPLLARCLARSLENMTSALGPEVDLSCLTRVDNTPGMGSLASAGSPAPGSADEPEPSQLDEPELSRKPLWLVPIPSTGSGWRRRGYDPVAMLVRCLIREQRLPGQMTRVPILAIRARPPWRRHHQKGLGRSARRRNVRNTMIVRRHAAHNIRLTAKRERPMVILLDDVLTTGSTLQEAAKTLEKSGLNVVAAVVLAAAKAPDQSHTLSPAEGLAEN